MREFILETGTSILNFISGAVIFLTVIGAIGVMIEGSFMLGLIGGAAIICIYTFLVYGLYLLVGIYEETKEINARLKGQTTESNSTESKSTSVDVDPIKV